MKFLSLIRHNLLGYAVLCFLFFVLATNASASQASITDRLEELDKIKVRDNSRFNAGLEELAHEYTSFSDYETGYFNILRGYQSLFNADYPQAREYLNNVLRYQQSEQLLFRANMLAVNLFMLSKSYTEAFVHLDQIASRLNQMNDQLLKEGGYGILALAYNQLGNYELGLNYALNYERMAKTDKGKCYSGVYKVESYLWSNKDQEFRNEIDNVINFCQQHEEFVVVGIARAYQLRFMLKNNHYDEALEYYQQHYDALVATRYPTLIAEYLAMGSKLYLHLGEFGSARELAERSISMVSANEASLPFVSAYESLYQIAKEQQQFEDALKFYEKYSSANRAYSDLKTQQQLAYYLARGEIEVKNQRIELLDKDNELLYLQQQLYRNEVRNSRVVLGLFSVLLIILAILAYRGLSGRKRFKLIAESDLLTGISNRYHFTSQARTALEYCQTNEQPAALILFDLDNFKAINEEHGHAAGDWTLQQVVKICRNFMRNNDVFGRIGGEEFAVLLPSCQADKAVLLAEICRDAISGIETDTAGHKFKLSASFGVSSSDLSGYNLKQLLADADAAMYKAKQSEREKVVAFS